ncbi:MAG TPA: hypothetical protein VMZ28_18115 [Kofleriaceae bacterium]|nr:hypothetical protein [Kofleriaceae bacterium]
MRSITPSILVAALASLSLAGGCSKKSEKKKDEQASTSAAPGASDGDGTADGKLGAMPAPHRMRSSSDPGATTQELGPMGHPGVDAETDQARLERREAMRERFAEQRAKHDKNGDGELDADERTAMRNEMMELRLKSIDKDGDGKITRDEAHAEPGRRKLLRDFDAADANQDQVVTTDELEAHIAERRANRRDEDGRRRDDGAGTAAPR